jgi:uncharacterized membrane protein YfcA
MVLILIIAVAFGAAMLTFFSGFGLGTILMPVFALFFPVEIAIALTAIVHLMNNLFKATLVWRAVNLKVVFWFAIPAAVAAFGGASLLNILSGQTPIINYTLGEKMLEVTLLKLVIAVLLIVFALAEINRRFEKITVRRSLLPLGGVLSGFFGGFSGHQGALRSLFLLRVGLSKEGFIATGIAAAIVIDISRLSVYGSSFFSRHFHTLNRESLLMLILACLSAFAGSWTGRRMLKKVTYRTVQLSVGILILVMALLLGTGII